MTIKQKFTDGFANFVAKLGIGTPNLNTYSGFGISRPKTRIELSNAYRSDWLIGAAIDMPASDMTREGVTFKGEESDFQKLEQDIEDRRIWDRISESLKWARLYGGSLAVLLIDGQDVSTPLIVDRLGKDSFKGIEVFDRWDVTPSLDRRVTEFGMNYGLPEFYTIDYPLSPLYGKRVHYSRCLRFVGLLLSHDLLETEQFWGASIVDRIWDTLISYATTNTGASQLVHKAYLRTVKIKDLRKIVSAGGNVMEGLTSQLKFMRQYQTIEGLTVLDADDSFETASYTFAGLGEIQTHQEQQLSGGMRIPLVRLFGQSPAGLNSTGESDLVNYYDGVRAEQDKIRPQLTTLFNVMYRSCFGKEPSETFNFEFNPLWVMSDSVKADIATKHTQAIIQASQDGLISNQTAMRELKNSSDKTGVFSSITNEDIEQAKDEEPPEVELDAESEQTETDSKMVRKAAAGNFSEGGESSQQSGESPRR